MIGRFLSAIINKATVLRAALNFSTLYGIGSRTVLLLSVALSPQFVLSAEPPAGWRVPTAKELAAEPLRKKSPTRNAKAVGDFNGDGTPDQAYQVISRKFCGEGLAVRLSSPKGFTWKIINQIDWGKDCPSSGLVMGIDLAKRGDYMTACGKGYWECGVNEPKVLKLKMPGIWHFRFESASSIWYWDHKRKEFKQVWISD